MYVGISPKTCCLDCIECGWDISFSLYISSLVGPQNQFIVGNSTVSVNGTNSFYHSGVVESLQGSPLTSSTYVYVRACVHACVRAYVRTYVHTYVRTYVCMYVCMHVFVSSIK